MHRSIQERATDARMAWLSIIGILSATMKEYPEQLDEVHMCLARAPSFCVSAVQFIMIGSGWSDEEYVATGTWDLMYDLPQLLSLHAAAGGSSHF